MFNTIIQTGYGELDVVYDTHGKYISPSLEDAGSYPEVEILSVHYVRDIETRRKLDMNVFTGIKDIIEDQI